MASVLFALLQVPLAVPDVKVSCQTLIKLTRLDLNCTL